MDQPPIDSSATMQGRRWVALGAFFAAAAVALGAIGAHFLEKSLSDSQLKTFEVAVRYQMFHALGLILVGFAARKQSSRWLAAAGFLFLAGIVLFSGGLFSWLITSQQVFVHVVPIGGMAWIVGWLLFGMGVLASGAPIATKKPPASPPRA